MSIQNNKIHTPDSQSGAISIGWLIVIAFVAVSALVVYQSVNKVMNRNKTIIGDGRTVESYRFDLSNALIPVDDIVVGGAIKDRVKTLVDPEVITPEEVDAFNEEERGKYLVSDDVVFGVSINGESRAYPLRVLVWHEIANDTLGGVPIAVTYNYLTNSLVVFDRRVDGETLEFGFSGLLYQSNSLFYDRQDTLEEESLWSQLLGKAVAGPAAEAGKALSVIPSQMVQYGVWLSKHPDTTVLDFNRGKIKQYQSNPGGYYFGSDELEFEVDPLPPAGLWPKKTPVAIVTINDERRVFPLPVLKERSTPGSIYRHDVGGVPVEFTYYPEPETIWIEADDPSLKIKHAFWFAWYALHPNDEVIGMEKPGA